MRCLLKTSPGLYNLFCWPFWLPTFPFLPSASLHCLLKVFQGFHFCQGGLGPINDVFISPAVSNYSEFQCKFMPTLFCVIKLVHFYAFQVILIITHFLLKCTFFTFYLKLTLIFHLISCIQLVYSQSTPFAFWTQLFFLYFSHRSRALLDIQPDVYKHVEKLQFSFSLISSLQ